MLGFCRKMRGPRSPWPGLGKCPILQGGVCISPLGELTSASLG